MAKKQWTNAHSTCCLVELGSLFVWFFGFNANVLYSPGALATPRGHGALWIYINSHRLCYNSPIGLCMPATPSSSHSGSSMNTATRASSTSMCPRHRRCSWTSTGTWRRWALVPRAAPKNFYFSFRGSSPQCLQHVFKISSVVAYLCASWERVMFWKQSKSFGSKYRTNNLGDEAKKYCSALKT